MEFMLPVVVFICIIIGILAIKRTSGEQPNIDYRDLPSQSSSSYNASNGSFRGKHLKRHPDWKEDAEIGWVDYWERSTMHEEGSPEYIESLRSYENDIENGDYW